jgi:hypothetical protein
VVVTMTPPNVMRISFAETKLVCIRTYRVIAVTNGSMSTVNQKLH